MITSPVVRNGTVGTFSPAIDTNMQRRQVLRGADAIEPMLNLSGLALAASITSLHGLERAVLADHEDEVEGRHRSTTGAKSRDQSYGSDLEHRRRDGVLAAHPEACVWPSGAARASRGAAVEPPAPGMFSITTACPVDCARPPPAICRAAGPNPMTS